MLEFGWTRHMIRTILVLSFDLCVHFFMVFLCLSHKRKLQEHFPLFIGLLILFEITYKLTISEYNPLKRSKELKVALIRHWIQTLDKGPICTETFYRLRDFPHFLVFRTYLFFIVFFHFLYCNL